ncbi:unnamed protein product, partial [Didymodactylos carnosus]
LKSTIKIFQCSVSQSSGSTEDVPVQKDEAASPRSFTVDQKSESATKAHMISHAMKNYLTRAREKQKILDDKIHEYEIGRRHLARMMGEDPEAFDQNKIDDALNYLMPSGLLDERARPKMRNVAIKLEQLKKQEQRMQLQGIAPDYSKNDEFGYTNWITKEKLEEILLEKLMAEDYKIFLQCLNRLIKHPLAFKEKEFINDFRTKVEDSVIRPNVEPLRYDVNGRPYQIATGECTRLFSKNESEKAVEYTLGQISI